MTNVSRTARAASEAKGPVSARFFAWPEQSDTGLLSSREALRWFLQRGLRVSLRTLQRWHATGALPGRRYGGRVLFREADLQHALVEGVDLRGADSGLRRAQS